MPEYKVVKEDGVTINGAHHDKDVVLTLDVNEEVDNLVEDGDLEILPVLVKYEVISDEGVVLEGEDDSVHAKGAVLELDPENQQVKDLLENGTLVVAPEEEDEGGEGTEIDEDEEVEAASAPAPADGANGTRHSLA